MERVFVYHISNKVLVARRNKNLKNSIIKVSCICHSADVYLKNWPLPKDNTEIVEVFHIFKILTKKVKCPYADHHETLMKETGEEINKRKDILCS